MILIFFVSGLPVWLKFVPGISFRTNNGPFKVVFPLPAPDFLNFCAHSIYANDLLMLELFMKAEMTRFTKKIVGMMKAEGLFLTEGGPIILSQVNGLITMGD